MMEVVYPEPLDPSDRTLLEKATRLLEGSMVATSSGAPAINTISGGLPTIGTSPTGVKAAWSKRVEHGRLVYALTLSLTADPSIEVNDKLYPPDLQDRASPPLLPFRMARLWGDLLEKYSRKQFQAFLKQIG
jgi:hypothetical protein